MEEAMKYEYDQQVVFEAKLVKNGEDQASAEQFLGAR